MRETEKYYFFWKHQFGQWTLRDIIDEGGINYNCCEQYMMTHKALLFDDLDSAKKILCEKDPREQQRLGRIISDFNQEIWDANKEEIVYRGNKLKFYQHFDLQKRLIETFPKIFVEASPYDRVWGVGLSANDDLILDEKNWKGENLLGKVLTRVRNDFVEGV
ncbi:NADAR family protein [archaeon]|jgi:ribA/ribD-fused uncharacterized protein|nr:NADAR family protein [archaeon]